LPRSYEESDKKLKTVKIVTKKGDASTDEKKTKKPKPMATSNKQLVPALQEEELQEVDEGGEENIEEQKNIEEPKEEPSVDQEENERCPLEEVQQPTLSVAEKLQAIGRKPAPFSKAATT